MNHLKITTSELAAICRVSQGTIDRALNNRSDIKEETKQKILNAAKLYGYRKPIESDAEKRIVGQIGIIIFNLNNEYFSELVTEVEEKLKNIGFSAVVMMTHYDERHEIECIRNMYNMGVDGIILCSVNSGDVFGRYLDMFDIPIVAVGNKIGLIPYVGIDDKAAMRDMTKKLIKDGYKKLVYFSPSLKYPNAYAQHLRYEGFLSAISEYEYEIVTEIEEIKEKYDKMTAIVCSSDYYAFQVYSKTPNAKITGFDNLKTIEKYKFNIDSVGYSVKDIARLSVECILKKQNHDVILKHSIFEH